MLIGTDGVYSFTFEHEKRPECPVCGGEAVDMSISKELTVDKLIETLIERQDMYVHCQNIWMEMLTSHCRQIKKPSLSSESKQIYFQAPPQLEEATRPNLEKKVSELVDDGGEITVTATTLPFSLSLRIHYT